MQVSAEERDGDATLCVRDNGVGSSRDYHRTIFELFTRVPAAGQMVDGAEVEGTGVGLAIVKRVVEEHGGRGVGRIDRRWAGKRLLRAAPGGCPGRPRRRMQSRGVSDAPGAKAARARATSIRGNGLVRSEGGFSRAPPRRHRRAAAAHARRATIPTPGRRPERRHGREGDEMTTSVVKGCFDRPRRDADALRRTGPAGAVPRRSLPPDRPVDPAPPRAVRVAARHVPPVLHLSRQRDRGVRRHEGAERPRRRHAGARQQSRRPAAQSRGPALLRERQVDVGRLAAAGRRLRRHGHGDGPQRGAQPGEHAGAGESFAFNFKPVGITRLVQIRWNDQPGASTTTATPIPAATSIWPASACPTRTDYYGGGSSISRSPAGTTTSRTRTSPSTSTTS